MENKKKKTMALGAVIMLCAVAVIGVGYATFAGNARTYNEANSADAGFMELVPGGEASAHWTAISSNVSTAFSEYTYSNSGTTTKAYYFDNATGSDTANAKSPIAGYEVKILGSKDYIFNNKTSAAITQLSFEVSSDKGVGNDDFVYVVKVATGSSFEYIVLDDAAATTSSVSFTGLSISATSGTATFTVSLCIAYLPDVYIPDSFIGPAVAAPGDTDHDQGAKTSSSGPASIATTNALALGFKVTDTTPSA